MPVYACNENANIFSFPSI